MKWFVHQSKDVNSFSIKGWSSIFPMVPWALPAFCTRISRSLFRKLFRMTSTRRRKKPRSRWIWLSNWADAPTQRVHSFWDDVFMTYGSIEILDRAVFDSFFAELQSPRRDLGGRMLKFCRVNHSMLHLLFFLTRFCTIGSCITDGCCAWSSHRSRRRTSTPHVRVTDLWLSVTLVEREGVTNQEWKGHIDDTFLGGKNVNESWKMITSLCGTTDLFTFQLVSIRRTVRRRIPKLRNCR